MPAALFAAVFALVLGLALAGGGYFPVTWGWASMALLSVAAAALLLRPRLAPTRRELVTLGALGSLAAWSWLSVLWSDGATQPVLEGLRWLLYLSVVGVVLLLIERRDLPVVFAAVLTAVTAACGLGLATRLFPDRLGTFDSVAVYRLAEPLGYWNSLGIFAVLGALLALAFVERGRLIARGLAAASLVVLVTTLYFTFSRGAWLALIAGVGLAVALHPRRRHLAVALLAAAVAPAAAVALASRSDSLVTRNAPLADATEEGRELALALPVLAVLAVLVVAGLALGERARGRARAALALGLVAAVAGAAIVAPSRIERDARDSVGPNLNARLFSWRSNGRVDTWTVALERYAEEPLLGSGAGGFERVWLRERTFQLKVRDAHSAYVETLSELGPLGLLVLVVALGVPLSAAVAARRVPLVPVAAGSYGAFVLHAGVDWDVEMPAVTATGLLLGGALLVAARNLSDVRMLAPRAVRAATAATIVLLVAAFVGFTGNAALEASSAAAAEGDWAAAEREARKATRWAPWSTEARRALGVAQLAGGDVEAALKTFREAVERDEGDWAAWLDLARASVGDERERALRRAEELNPLAVEIARFRSRRDPGEGFDPDALP